MILITGAAGTVGSEVVKQLQKTGAKFRAGYASEAKAAEARAKGIDAVVANYADAQSLDAALAGVDKLFLLAGGAPNQTELELNVVAAAKRAGVKHIVKLSVWGAEGEAFSFAKVHRPVEKAIEKSGATWTHLRPNGFMQNMATYMGSTIRGEGAFYVAAGDAQISHVDVRDIAAVAVKALTEPGHENTVYTLSGPAPLTYNEIAETLTRAAGKPVKYVDLPAATYKEAIVGAGVPPAYADAMINLYDYYKEGHARATTNDVKRVTGRDPIPFAQFAEENAQAFR